MHKSQFTAVLFAAAVCLRQHASASPFLPRDITNPVLKPWVSVDTNGGLATTITPIITSISGVATTIGAAPAFLTQITTTSQGDSSLTDAPSVGGAYYPCNNVTEGTFCLPTNGSTVYVGGTYYVTWDSDVVGGENATFYIMADYVNTTGGPIAFQSSPTAGETRFLALTIEKEWLQGQSSNNITLHINPVHPHTGQPVRYEGPTVMVSNKPADYYRQAPTKSPTGQSLYIALPLTLVFICLCVIGGSYLNRKRRQIGLGNVMGRRKGYGAGKSRRQCLRLNTRKQEDVVLRSQIMGSDGRYHDVLDEEQRGRQREGGREGGESDFGSLAGSPMEDRTNHFRDEIRRQDQERYNSRIGFQ